MNAQTPGRFSDAELDDIRSREAVTAVFERFGHKLRRAGRISECLCPFHAEKTPSCQIDDGKGVFYCQGCSTGGNVFDAVIKLRGCSFPEAVEFLGGTRELTELDLARIEKRNRERDEQAQAERARTVTKVERTWSNTVPIRGTHAHAYLEARGLNPAGCVDLRFAAALPYWGFASEDAQEVAALGEFPAMVAAIRSADGIITGLHRTFLDRDEPVKLKPPGDRTRNRAKKITGEQRGGSIALTKPSPRMAYGEGIETTLSWRVLMGAEADGFGLAALVSLGNICGGATGSRPHPTRLQVDGRPIWIPNGDPDFDRPGFVPGPEVEEAILIGDGDSDDASTRARLLTASRRWSLDPRRPTPLLVRVSMADAGFDFNDLLLREAEDA